MPDDKPPAPPSEWFQSPEEPQPAPPSTGDLRWPSPAPPAPVRFVETSGFDDSGWTPVAVRPPAPPPVLTTPHTVTTTPHTVTTTTPAAAEPATPGTHPAGFGGTGWRVRRAGTAEQQPWDEPVPPPVVDDLPPTVIPPAPALRPRFSTRRLTTFGAALLTVVALAALAISDFSHSTPSITQPSSVGTLTQLSDPPLDAAMQTVQRAVITAGASNVVDGVYGTNGQPQLVLIVVQGSYGASGSRSGLQGFFDRLATGTGANGWTLDRTHATLTSVNGTPFECSPVSAPALRGATLSTCAWNDANAAGVVFDVTGQSMASTLGQAVQARTATEG